MRSKTRRACGSGRAGPPSRRPLALQRLWPGRSPCIHRLESTWNPHAGARRACAVAVALGVKRDVSAHRSTKRRRIKREPACRGSACTAAVALAVAAACPDAHHSTHCVAQGRVPGSSCPWRARRVPRERRAGQVWRGEMTDQKKKNSLTHHPRPTMRRCGRRARAGAPPVPTRPSRPARTARRTSWGPCGA